MSVGEESWEARMAARAQARQREAETLARNDREVKEAEAFQEAAQRPWLHGWPRMGRRTVLIGTGVHCVCCGRLQGVTCVAFPADWSPPGADPDWPFSDEDCPLCVGRGS